MQTKHWIPLVWPAGWTVIDFTMASDGTFVETKAICIDADGKLQVRSLYGVDGMKPSLEVRGLESVVPEDLLPENLLGPEV